MLEKEFVPYTEASALKELGFDEKCICIYNREKALRLNNLDNPADRNKSIKLNFNNGKLPSPTYSQAFDFFEEKYFMFIERRVEVTVNEIFDIIYSIKSWRFNTVEITFKNPYDVFDRDKARLECVKKLIEICEK